jgi:hypothetical protein
MSPIHSRVLYICPSKRLASRGGKSGRVSQFGLKTGGDVTMAGACGTIVEVTLEVS